MEKKETNRDIDFATDELLKSGCNRGNCPYRRQLDARPSCAETIAGVIGVLFLTALFSLLHTPQTTGSRLKLNSYLNGSYGGNQSRDGSLHRLWPDRAWLVIMASYGSSFEIALTSVRSRLPWVRVATSGRLRTGRPGRRAACWIRINGRVQPCIGLFWIPETQVLTTAGQNNSTWHYRSSKYRGESEIQARKPTNPMRPHFHWRSG
jgi:hypothetical protein